MMCDRNCFECPYPDCVLDEVSLEEYRESDERDKQEERAEKLASAKDKKAEWRIKNIEKHRKSCREYAERNPDRMRKYYEDNKDAINEKRRSYRERNRDRIRAAERERMRRYRAENPEYYRQKEREAREEKRIRDGVLTKKERMIQQQDRMYEFLVKYITEHLYPPTVTEISESLSISQSNVYRDLDILQERGLIVLGRGKKAIRLIGYRLVKEADAVGE